MGTFTFKNTICSTYGIVATGKDVFNAPEKDITEIEIPGRNGNLTISNKRFKNIRIGYPIFIHGNFASKAKNAREWLLSGDGYQRLTDSYDPGEFRLAIFKGPIDFDMRALNTGGTTELVFDCKPQRFLTSGETTTTISTSSGSITNPTQFDALPLITITGTGAGTVTIGDVTITISSMARGKIILDSEPEDAYYSTYNLNSTISLDHFPILRPGSNTVRRTGSISKIEIIPRWWTI